MSTVTGHNFIGGRRSAAGTITLESLDASTGEALPARFYQATPEEVDSAANAADEAFAEFRQLKPERRAEFLEAIADEIDQLGDDFVALVCRETALPAARIQGERGRTSGQMRLFAKVLRRGDFLGARIDLALPERKPLPRADLRQYRIGVGPVAVFGASNFPLAFSTAGGDTASAFAAGCPVVFKAHSGHMATADQVGCAIIRAAEKTGMPKGVFNMIFGAGVGERLIKHPAIQAVGFTGSLHGGNALSKMAAEREQPIPVFAEMSSINPVIVLPQALAARGSTVAKDLAASVTLGGGQFCTNPGLVIGLRSPVSADLSSNCASTWPSRLRTHCSMQAACATTPKGSRTCSIMPASLTLPVMPNRERKPSRSCSRQMSACCSNATRCCRKKCLARPRSLSKSRMMLSSKPLCWHCAGN